MTDIKIGTVFINEAQIRRLGHPVRAYVVTGIRTYETEKETRVTYIGYPFNNEAKVSGAFKVEARPYNFEDRGDGPTFSVIGHKDDFQS